MRINKNLYAFADSNPTKETAQQTITDLCQGIEDGVITLPLYQRDLSWTLQKCVALLNYQLTGKAPVSAISINVINNTDIGVPQVTFLDRELVETKSGLKSVVDGQQRISTNYKAYINSPDFKNIMLDLAKGKFVLIDEGAEYKKQQIPVGVLLNKDITVFNKYVGKFPNDVQNILSQVRNKFKTYNYTVNQAKDLSEEEQIEWFEVLNNAGSRVSEVQMRLAKLKIYGIDIYTQYAHVYVEKVKEFGYDEVFLSQTTNLSYPVSALNPAYEVIIGQQHSNNYCPMAPDVKENAICSMQASQIRFCFEMTLNALNKALNFIDDNGLNKPDRVDYINYLLGFFVFNPEPLTEEDKNYLIDWYKKTNFSNQSNTARRNIFTNLIYRIK